LLIDVIAKEKMHFLSFQEIIAAWRLTDAIVDYVKQARLKPVPYAEGSSGPTAHLKLPKQDGFSWYDLK
jgi:glucose-6-phosphate 1-dehydrogenase